MARRFMGVKINPLAVGNVLVVIACFAVVARIADPAEVWARMSAMSGVAVLQAIALHALIICLLAWRWRGIVTALGLWISNARALTLTFASTVLNLTLPTGVGGDLGRVWLGRTDGIDAVSGSAAAVIDRVTGLLTLVLIVFLAILSGQFVEISSTMTLAVAGAAIVVVLIGLTQASRIARNPTIQRFADSLRRLLSRPSVLVMATALSITSHVIAALIAMVIAQGMGLDFSFLTALILFPAVILAGMMPVSVGGWGVRELAAIPLLAQAGLDAGTATAITIIFGVTQLIAAGLGTILGLSRSVPSEAKQ